MKNKTNQRQGLCSCSALQAQLCHSISLTDVCDGDARATPLDSDFVINRISTGTEARQSLKLRIGIE
jgi:hypothetical protein